MRAFTGVCSLVLLGLAACNGRSPADDLLERDTLAIRELASGYQGPQNSIETAVRDTDRLAELWPDATDPPSVDFDEEQVVIVALGRRSTGGYGVQVTGARIRDDTLILEYVERQPGPGCMTTQAITAPYQIVAVPAVTPEVEFVRRVEISDC